MKFKGFFKGLWEQEKIWFRWLKDYWLAYIIFVVVVYIICLIPFFVQVIREEIKAKKKHKKIIWVDMFY